MNFIFSQANASLNLRNSYSSLETLANEAHVKRLQGNMLKGIFYATMARHSQNEHRKMEFI